MKHNYIAGLVATALLAASPGANSAIGVNAYTVESQYWTGFFWQTVIELRCRSWTTEPGSDYIFVFGFSLKCRQIVPWAMIDVQFQQLYSPELIASVHKELNRVQTDPCLDGPFYIEAGTVVQFDTWTGWPNIENWDYYESYGVCYC